MDSSTSISTLRRGLIILALPFGLLGSPNTESAVLSAAVGNLRVQAGAEVFSRHDDDELPISRVTILRGSSLDHFALNWCKIKQKLMNH